MLGRLKESLKIICCDFEPIVFQVTSNGCDETTTITRQSLTHGTDINLSRNFKRNTLRETPKTLRYVQAGKLMLIRGNSHVALLHAKSWDGVSGRLKIPWVSEQIRYF